MLKQYSFNNFKVFRLVKLYVQQQQKNLICVLCWNKRNALVRKAKQIGNGKVNKKTPTFSLLILLLYPCLWHINLFILTNGQYLTIVCSFVLESGWHAGLLYLPDNCNHCKCSVCCPSIINLEPFLYDWASISYFFYSHK